MNQAEQERLRTKVRDSLSEFPGLIFVGGFYEFYEESEWMTFTATFESMIDVLKYEKRELPYFHDEPIEIVYEFNSPNRDPKYDGIEWDPNEHGWDLICESYTKTINGEVWEVCSGRWGVSVYKDNKMMENMPFERRFYEAYDEHLMWEIDNGLYPQ